MSSENKTGVLTSATLYLTPTPSLKIKKLDEQAILPAKAHTGDLGYDLFALEDTQMYGATVTKVRTGIACSFPYGFGALLRDRSSVATKQQLFVVAGVIDNGYTGEIIVAFYNPHGPFMLKAGMKIAQMILTPVVTFPTIQVDELGTTARGTDGFGSTGR
jgi:dUTP pyrophosphatase